MQYRWQIKEQAQEAEQLKLQRALGMNRVTAQILLQRDIRSFNQAKDFFRPDNHKLHDPFLMKDMGKAVERLQAALEEGQGVLVYGDYDVDGTTSVALICSFFKQIAFDHFDSYVPDRYKEGYGLSKQGIDYACEKGYSLMICLDCGIKAIDQVAYANEKGLDIIICDHHRPAEDLPKAYAILDPKQKDCDYPCKELSGCGIGYKLITAWSEKFDVKLNHDGLIDLCAISIACDIVPLTGENRILSALGLASLNEKPRPGIKAMLEKAGKGDELENTNLVFIIGPRINAAGRIKHAKEAVSLLLAEQQEEVRELVEAIEAFNLERRETDQQTTNEALEMIKKSEFLSKANSTVVFKEDWHKGVIGIVASRIIENYYRPTIVLTETEKGKLAGSARSVHDFDVYQAIEACEEDLIQFGGHKYAAGLTMEKKKLNSFQKRFEEVVSKSIAEDQKNPFVSIDLEIGFDEISNKLIRQIAQMAPFGPQNMKPTFLTRGLVDEASKLVGQDRTHLKLKLRELKTDIVMEGIGFSLGEWINHLHAGKPIDLAYNLEFNEWNGRKRIQLMVKDIKASE